MLVPARPSLSARWAAAGRARLEGTRPSTPAGDVAAERALERERARPVGVARWAARRRWRSAPVSSTTKWPTPSGAASTRWCCWAPATTAAPCASVVAPIHWFEVDLPATLADKRRRLDALGVAAGNVRSRRPRPEPRRRRRGPGLGRPRRAPAVALRGRECVRHPHPRVRGRALSGPADAGRPGQRPGRHVPSVARARSARPGGHARRSGSCARPSVVGARASSSPATPRSSSSSPAGASCGPRRRPRAGWARVLPWSPWPASRPQAEARRAGLRPQALAPEGATAPPAQLAAAGTRPR